MNLLHLRFTFSFLFLFTVYSYLFKYNDHKCIIILGSENKTELTQRLFKGIELYYNLNNNEFPVKFLVSGKGKDYSNNSEALFMKKFLIKNNIPRDSIIVENNSTNTVENIYLINKILNNNFIYDKLFIITHDFHVDGGRLSYIIHEINKIQKTNYKFEFIKVNTKNRSHYSHHMFLEKKILLNSSVYDIINLKLKYNI
jgi:vancomycin permeability regulator SanA